MLCISRRKGQSFKIGDYIEVEITDIRNGQVRLGVTAPGMPIVRDNANRKEPKHGKV